MKPMWAYQIHNVSKTYGKRPSEVIKLPIKELMYDIHVVNFGNYIDAALASGDNAVRAKARFALEFDKEKFENEPQQYASSLVKDEDYEPSQWRSITQEDMVFGTDDPDFNDVLSQLTPESGVGKEIVENILAEDNTANVSSQNAENIEILIQEVDI